MLMIGVGRRSYALPFEHVRHIVSLRPEFCCFGDGVESYLAFEGAPIPFVSTWDALGEKTAYQEYAELHAMLPQRKQDHLDWMAALEGSLRQGHSFAKARSPYECAFGKWYYGFRAHNSQLGLLLKRFEQPHARIHALADQLLQLVEEGHQDEALARFQRARETTLQELVNLFAEADRLVLSLQRRVAILVHHGGLACALGADEVKAIASIPPERIAISAGMRISQRAGSKLVILDDGTVVPVMDWQRWLGCGAGLPAEAA
jgi:hypothetical protein